MFTIRAITAAAAGAALAVTLGTTAASASTHAGISGVGLANATTTLTNHPDSSTQGGTWALDNFTRKATVMFTGFAPASNCPGAPLGAMCFRWVGSISDLGTFTTVTGAKAPRLGSEEQALTGQFKGGSSTVTFYTDSLSASASGVPKAINGPVTAAEGTSVWVEQMFPAHTVFGDNLGNWSWSYTLPAGTDRACPHLGNQQWVDDLATGGNNPSTSPLVDNVITPKLGHC